MYVRSSQCFVGLWGPRVSGLGDKPWVGKEVNSAHIEIQKVFKVIRTGKPCIGLHSELFLNI